LRLPGVARFEAGLEMQDATVRHNVGLGKQRQSEAIGAHGEVPRLTNGDRIRLDEMRRVS